MFKYRFSDEFKRTIKKLIKKDRKRSLIVAKKVREIIDNNKITISRYKNLKHNLKNLKRVHIDSSFVLCFEVDKKLNLITFLDLQHHDVVYKK
jgi:YafQ family addiction module toxin component